jgi:hypothetical protein
MSVPDAHDVSRKPIFCKFLYQEIRDVRRMDNFESTRENERPAIAAPPRSVLDIGTTGQNPFQIG